MQKFAPREVILPPGGCPSAEDLAAYIDGTLGKAESARITEHLASCEDCYAVYMETLHFQLESSAAEPQGVIDAEVRQFRRPSKARPAQQGGALGGSWKSPVRWLPIAALLLVGVGGGSTYFAFLAPPSQLVAPATPTLASLPQGDQSLWLGPTYRGEGNEEEAKINEAPFRMGVQLVNLQATLQAGKAQESQDVIARILNLLKSQPFTDDLSKRYSGITTTLEKRPPAELLPEASRLAKKYREEFEPGTALDFGQWVEAGRLAALAHDPSFFQQSDTQTFLRRLRWREKLGLGDTKLDPLTRESLNRIAEIVSKEDLRPSDYDNLKQQLEKILDHYYPET